MYRRTIKLGRPLAGVVIATGSQPESPPACDEVLSFVPPPIAPPPEPVADPVELKALRGLLAELGPVIEKLRARERAEMESLGQATVELAVALAERLLNTEIAADRQRLDRIVRGALERTQPARAITVRGHADDLTLLQRQVGEQNEAPAPQTTLSFRADTALERGHLKIEADDWFVEFDTQRSLAELRERLLEETFADE